MDVYNFPEHGNADAYPIQEITDTNSQLTNPLLQPLETMYNESIPELFVDQGMYYPSAPNYGYICTGLESPGDWDDHPRVFGVDGQNIQFVGTQTDSLPYVYYTPNYGYAQSPYNPYNPYIPGAIISTDGSFVGPQQYYIPTYDNGTNSPAYYPMIVQPGSEIFTTDQFMDMNSSSSPATFSLNSSRVATNHTQNKVSEGFKNNGGLKKLNPTNGGVTSNSLSGPASSPMLQGEGGQSQTINNLSNGKSASNHNQLKPTLPSGNSFGPSGNGRAATDKARSTPNCLGEQNRGPRTNTTNTRLTVKAYSTKAGNSDAQGNITISVDQYNKDDFPVDYVNAKFFVIKSYSEDDVHKSIKYNVWSSTPNGNKKLNNAFEEAKNNGCPVFLFFSVNASGQFCGVAEMTGNVDFHEDMDFWQQDKWSGSFPVKWHIIKDVPNPHFRHIILENNEHKPVTNSRDTQEIKYKKGVEMLKVFKKYTSKTSLLDDFMYYENRQKILQEEKARLLIKSYGASVFVPVLHPPRKLNNLLGLDSKENDINTSNSNNVDGKPTEEDEDVLRFRSLAINSESGDVLTVGSMPVKVKGFGESSGYVTVGTIPLDYKVFEVKESDGNKKG